MTHACAWRVANPDKAHGGSGTHCWGWSCRTDPAKCSRKAHAANKRKAEQSAYRKFPGSAVQQARKAAWDDALAEQQAMAQSDRLTDDQWQVVRAAGALPRGHCSWCGGGIRNPKRPAELALNRTWHSGKLRGQYSEPDCLWEYYLHTRAPEQLSHLLHRDGPACASCGEVSGRWGDRQEMDPDRMRARSDPYWAKAYPAAVYVGPFTRVQWATSLQVDHRLALGLVVLVTPLIDRWTWWGPGNLQLLCHPCHVAKTKADVAKIKRARLLLAGVAQPALL